MPDTFFSPYEKPAKPHLVRGQGGLSGEIVDLRSDLGSAFARVDDRFSSVGEQTLFATTESMLVFVDFDNGDDANDGLSWAGAKKTLQAGIDVLPYFVLHHCVIFVRGKQPDTAQATLSKLVALNVYLIIEGGLDQYEVVYGPRTIDGGTNLQPSDSTMSLTPDQYAGYLLRGVGGATDGQLRMLQKHDATTFIPGRGFSTSVTGNQVEVVRPGTEINGTLFVGCAGEGFVRLQNLFFNNLGDSSILSIFNSAASVAINACMSNSANSFNAVQSLSSRSVGIYNAQTDSTTFSSVSLNTIAAGLGIISQNPLRISGGSGPSAIQGSVVGPVDIYESFCVSTIFGFGARARGKVDLSNIGPSSSFLPTFNNTPSYNPLIIDGSSSVGLKITDATVRISGSLNIENNAGHAIENVNGLLQLNIAVGGAGNGGAGAYPHSGAIIHTKAGAPPTVTGSAGEISLDGATPKTTWAAVDGGTPVNGATAGNDEFVIVKKV